MNSLYASVNSQHGRLEMILERAYPPYQMFQVPGIIAFLKEEARLLGLELLNDRRLELCLPHHLALDPMLFHHVPEKVQTSVCEPRRRLITSRYLFQVLEIMITLITPSFSKSRQNLEWVQAHDRMLRFQQCQDQDSTIRVASLPKGPIMVLELRQNKSQRK